MTEAFNVRHLIREVLRTSTLADPGALAAEVMKRIPEDMLGVALEQVLRDVVRNEMSRQRVHRNASPIAATGPDLRPGPRLTPVFDDAARAPAPRSAKVSAIRDGWQKRLMDRIHTGEGARDYKLLRACTYEDLLFAAKERREHADRNASVARQYDAWARLINEYDVQTFGDLPAEAQMGALGSAA